MNTEVEENIRNAHREGLYEIILTAGESSRKNNSNQR